MSFFFRKHFSIKHHLIIAQILTIIAIVFFHIWQLATVPRGLYVDESSIGLNAALIAQTGKDEHHVIRPTYFEAFGEYKNPLYIYAAAAVFRTMGISEFSLRFTSFVFFAVFLLSWICLVRSLFRKDPLLLLFATGSAGFLPWFFELSRIAFEVISQLTLVTVALCLVWQTYEHAKQRKFWPLLCGLMIGLSFYSYSTARLLTPLFILCLLLAYRARKFWWTHAKVIASSAVAVFPALFFMQTHPGALTLRFGQVTYLGDTSLSFIQKVGRFLLTYLQFLSPQYLFYRGDSIVRHNPGPGGELFVGVGFLAIVGAWWLLKHRREKRFYSFVLLSVLCSPIAAALTTGDSSLRSLLLGVFLLMLSCFGFRVLQHISDVQIRRPMIGAVFLLLIGEVGAYLYNYFLVFPTRSIWEFQSFDTRQSIVTALKENTTGIIFSSHGNNQYAQAAFYSLTLGLPLSAIAVGDPVAAPGRCAIVTAFDTSVVNEKRYRVKTFGNPGDFTSVKCY